MLNLFDQRGRTIWIAEHRRDFEPHLPGLTDRGERYRIVPRTVSALGGSVQVWVLVLTGSSGGVRS